MLSWNAWGEIQIDGRRVVVHVDGRGGSTPQGGPDPYEWVDFEAEWDDTGDEFSRQEYERWGDYILENCIVEDVPLDYD
jgi:hypothetical protein